MPFPGESWPLHLKVVACIFHTIAISSSIFRLTYRWYISRFGSEDAWALLALFTDLGCLICLWFQHSARAKLSKTETILNWIAMTCLTATPWEARLSMISAIIRITNPCRPSVRRLSYTIAFSFGAMWIVIYVQKIHACSLHRWKLPGYVAISQSTADAISDVLLLCLPIYFLKGVKISRAQRILLHLSFTSSVCITIISIAHAVFLFLAIRTGISLLLLHIKVALSVVICNLLIIVTFAYRFYPKMDVDLRSGSDKSDPIQLTTVIPGQTSLGGCMCSTSLTSPCFHCSSSSRTQTTMYLPYPPGLVHDLE